jgi:hypothetical protein
LVVTNATPATGKILRLPTCVPDHPGDPLREQVREFGRRLIGKQRHDVHAAAGSGTFSRGSGYAEVGLADGPDLKLHEQIGRLADYIRTHVMGNFKQAFGRTRSSPICVFAGVLRRQPVHSADTFALHRSNIFTAASSDATSAGRVEAQRWLGSTRQVRRAAARLRGHTVRMT